MKKIALWLVGLVLAVGAEAADATDFVATLIAKAETESQASVRDYECTQIGPTMISMMSAAIPTNDKIDAGEREAMELLLSQLKSICVFAPTARYDYYYGLATGMLEARSTIYEEIVGSDDEATVWCRRTGSKVIELVVITYKAGTALTIVGITGDIDEELIATLMAMQL